jgi:hypothetical protein
VEILAELASTSFWGALMTKQLSRRTMTLASAASASLLVLGCKEDDFSCAESPDLSEADKTVRSSLGYQDRASDPAQACKLCRQFASGDGCGSCKVMAGPVHPMGTCKIFMGEG